MSDLDRSRNGNPSGRFVDRVVFITGGAAGFGRAFARAFAREGAAVVIAGVDIDDADRTAKELRGTGVGAISVECDASDEGAPPCSCTRIRLASSPVTRSASAAPSLGI